MRLLVSGNTANLVAHLAGRPDRIGVLATPRGRHALPGPGVTFACDNDCFKGLRSAAWLRFLAKLAEHEHKPLWVACPDAVGDMAQTWRLYDVWAPVLRSLGLPVALVLQDGLERLRHRARLPWAWDEIAAVFVGGSTAFKEGDFAAECVTEAKRRGKWVHVGRANSRRRIERFHRLGADSFDGSGFSRWDYKVADALRWLDGMDRQGSLFAA